MLANRDALGMPKLITSLDLLLQREVIMLIEHRCPTGRAYSATVRPSSTKQEQDQPDSEVN